MDDELMDGWLLFLCTQCKKNAIKLNYSVNLNKSSKIIVFHLSFSEGVISSHNRSVAFTGDC